MHVHCWALTGTGTACPIYLRAAPKTQHCAALQSEGGTNHDTALFQAQPRAPRSGMGHLLDSHSMFQYVQLLAVLVKPWHQKGHGCFGRRCHRRCSGHDASTIWTGVQNSSEFISPRRWTHRICRKLPDGFVTCTPPMPPEACGEHLSSLWTKLHKHVDKQQAAGQPTLHEGATCLLDDNLNVRNACKCQMQRAYHHSMIKDYAGKKLSETTSC